MVEPRATYRLQLQAGFTFADAARAVPYLAELGISHVYLSPILEAAEGSTHGYDVVDPDRVAGALGGEHGFAALAERARAAGIAVLLDIVPNHMSIAGRRNRWWYDVLENGPASYYAHYFDVDWAAGDDRVLLPILTERYGRALQSGAIRVVLEGPAGFAVRAGDAVLPVAPAAIGTIVRRAAERIGHAELAFVGDTLAELPSPARHERLARRRRHRDKQVLLGRLAALVAGQPACADALAAELAGLAADPGALDAVLEQQPYRLAHWSVAADQLGYRRFFDINTLVAIREEDPDVFAASHARILALVETGAVEGLRIDHVDGLRDPAGYLSRLRGRAPAAWIVVEKILSAGETLPPSWPVDGTTGYDFMEKVGGLFVDPAGEAPMTRAFEQLTGETWDPGQASRRARREVMSDALHSEVARLVELAVRACARSPACRDYTRAEIEVTLAEILAGYPTYRTYLSDGERSEIDRARLATAVAAARDHRPDLDVDLLAFLAAALAFEVPGDSARELAYSAQQVTGAITAKGDEDTVLYRQVRLLARCEVGAELRAWSHAPSVVHAALAAARPRGLLATATHDNKRGEDARARIAAISELPDAWIAAVTRWRARGDRYWTCEPDRVLEYALWQTLVGSWPLPLDRVRAYARKAAREARLRTSWRRPDTAYEAAIERWLAGVYGDRELLADLELVAVALAGPGDRNSLAQLVVKLTAPGVPDFYQGTELRDDSLVDPDNRRPVDLAARHAVLRALAEAQPRTAPSELAGRKLWTIRRALAVRRRHPGSFSAPYRALEASGPHAHRVFAFARGDHLIAIVPRLSAAANGWPDTAIELPGGAWHDVLADQRFSGGVQPVAALWRALPVALLVRSG